MRLKQIKIKGFRGFNKECLLSLDADIILFYGLNGTGKSSFTEALEWLFFGNISRRNLSPCRSEYQYQDYLRNLFYEGADNPYVEVEGLINNVSFKVRKELISEKQSKYFINDKEVDTIDSLPINLESYSRPMLAQTEISALVNTEQKDRWEQLSYILGQEDLTRLRQHLIEVRNSKKDKVYKDSDNEFNGLLFELEKFSNLNELKQAFMTCDIEKSSSCIGDIVKQEGVDVSPGNFGEAIKIKMKRVLGNDVARRVVDIVVGTKKTYDSVVENISVIFKELEECVLDLSKDKIDFEMISFLTKGKQYAKVPECPFCLARSLTEQRLKDIDKEISSANKANKNKESFYQLLKKVNQGYSLLQIKSKFQEILPISHDLKVLAQKLSDLELSELAGEAQAYDKKIVAFIDSEPKGLHSSINSYCSSLEGFYFHDNKTLIPEDAKRSLLEKYSEISKAIDLLLSEWIKLRDKVVKAFVLPTKSSQEKEVERWILIDKVNNFILNKKTFLGKKILLERIDNIQVKLEAFEKKEVEKLLTDHSEEIRDYYNRLNPDEKISFKKIEVRGGARRQARLVAEAYGKEINPVTIFSEAHTNSLSLSIYFPQRVDRNETWNVVILDDPVQSMDQNHSCSLIEILAEIKEKKQVIVLTHSKAFAEDFVGHFDLDELLHYEFYDGGEDGPIIKIRQGKTLDYLAHVEKTRNGDQISRESAGNTLRKAIAAVIGEILFKKGRTLSQIRSFDKQGLTKLFDQIERAGIDLQDLGKLKALVSQSHSDSHTWTVRDTSPTGLLQGITNIREVYDKYVA